MRTAEAGRPLTLNNPPGHQETIKRLTEIQVGPEQTGNITVIVTGPTGTPNGFGERISGLLLSLGQKARNEGKMPVFDLATGGTYKDISGPLKSMSRLFRKLKPGLLSHEQAVPDPDKGSPIDYSGQTEARISELGFWHAHLITNPEKVRYRKGSFWGRHNVDYVPLNRLTRRRRGMQAEDVARDSAATYGEIYNAYGKGDQFSVIGFVGVGEDRHGIGEPKRSDLTGASGTDPRQAYAYPIWQNTKEGGVANIPGDPKFLQYSNLMNEEHHGSTYLFSPGFQEFLYNDHLIMAFNSAKKQNAFVATMDALNGNFGKGESIYPDLYGYASALQLVENDKLAEIAGSNNPGKSRLLFKEIYAQLHMDGAHYDDPAYINIYNKLMDYQNRYLGPQNPNSLIVAMRALMGLDTTIVATTEVVENTPYAEQFLN